ncbi:hypothetical protein [Immundisolibacter sp.]
MDIQLFNIFDADIKLVDDLCRDYWIWNIYEQNKFNLIYKYGEDKIKLYSKDKKLYMKLSSRLYFNLIEKLSFLKANPLIFTSTTNNKFILEKQD